VRPAESAPDRRPASELPTIKGLRFIPGGAEGSLVNISPAGLLAESTSRLAVGSSIQVRIAGGFTPNSVTGRIARCEVASMGRDGILRYHIAVEFDKEIALETPKPEPPPVPQGSRNRW
jgi:hypothetical protein